MGDADGVHYLIEAAAHLVHKIGRKDVHFLLMGAGPEYASLVEQRDRLGLQAFMDLPGRVTNEFLFTALRTTDVGVSCDPKNSYNDHCTMNKVLEYMAFAKPQVMFDLKEGRASAEDAALYVPENSAVKLAEMIAQLLEDEPLRAKLGSAGAARMAGPLNWEHSVEQLLQAYSVALT
jgi:glycosyltransferase involved in cell wall biosynthesis